MKTYAVFSAIAVAFALFAGCCGFLGPNSPSPTYNVNQSGLAPSLPVNVPGVNGGPNSSVN